MSNHISSLAYAYGKPDVTGILKREPADFIVNEILSFEPSGEGEHVFLYIKKTNLNTLDVCDKISKHFHVHSRHVAYAGLKDKNAMTTQWFSFPFPIKEVPDVAAFNSEYIHVVQATRNNKKLKRGAIKCNHFNIITHELSGDLSTIEEKIQVIKKRGVPNYYAAQRFGKNENNIDNAKRMFAGKISCSRNKKSIFLSAARSFLFNEVVSLRVADGSWITPIAGDIAVLNNTRSFFVIENSDTDVENRLNKGDIHLSAPLWGEGESLSFLDTKELEQTVIKQSPELSNGLVQAGLKQDRRAMRLLPLELEFELNGNYLILSFNLPSGSYATSVLREILF